MSFGLSAKAGAAPVRSAATARSGALQVVAMAVGARHKGALHHVKSRPIKYTPADKRHVGATYEKLPPPPPEYVVVDGSKPAAKAQQ